MVTFQIPYRKLGVITGRYKEESFVAKPGRLKMEVHNEKPIEIFFSYARKDERLMSELEKHLHIMQRQGLITGWHDNKISQGEEWEQETTVHLNRADIILLLISLDFMASEYCYSAQMERALQRHEKGEALVIPVILRAVDLEVTPH